MAVGDGNILWTAPLALAFGAANGPDGLANNAWSLHSLELDLSVVDADFIRWSMLFKTAAGTLAAVPFVALGMAEPADVTNYTTSNDNLIIVLPPQIIDAANTAEYSAKGPAIIKPRKCKVAVHNASGLALAGAALANVQVKAYYQTGKREQQQ